MRNRPWPSCPSGTSDVSPRGPSPNCSINCAALPFTVASPLGDFCSPRDQPRNPALFTFCQVSLESCVHRGTSTAPSVTTHALAEPVRPTLVRRHPQDPREFGNRRRSQIHGALTGGPMSKQKE